MTLQCRSDQLRNLLALKPDGAARRVRGIEVGAEPGGGRAVGQRADHEPVARFALAALGCCQRVQVAQERTKIGLHGRPALLHAIERRGGAKIEAKLGRAGRRLRPGGRLRGRGASWRQRNGSSD